LQLRIRSPAKAAEQQRGALCSTRFGLVWFGRMIPGLYEIIQYTLSLCTTSPPSHTAAPILPPSPPLLDDTQRTKTKQHGLRKTHPFRCAAAAAAAVPRDDVARRAAHTRELARRQDR